MGSFLCDLADFSTQIYTSEGNIEVSVAENFHCREFLLKICMKLESNPDLLSNIFDHGITKHLQLLSKQYGERLINGRLKMCNLLRPQEDCLKSVMANEVIAQLLCACTWAFLFTW